MKAKNLFPAIILTSVLLPICAGAQSPLIGPTTQNGSFELLGGLPSAAKATHWDTDPDGDVDNWTLWTGVAVNLNDSGTDTSAAATDGTHVAFLQGNNAAYNLTPYTIQVGDIFTYSWDWVLSGRGTAIAELGYWNGSTVVAIAGTDSTNPNNTTQHIGLGNTYTALAGDPGIGSQIAVTIRTPADSNYPEVDNFVLQIVPEPSILALGGLGIFLLLKRKCFAC